MTSRMFFEKLFSNWIVKLLSIAAAVVLFLFQRMGSLEERFFSVPLGYEVNDSYVVTDMSIGSVRINMRGSDEEIFNVLEDDIEAYVDISYHKSEGIFKSPVLLRKTGSAENVHVEMSVEPLEATVTIEEKISKELEIVLQIKGYPATGYELVQSLMTPRVVEISGPRSQVEPIERLQTDIVDLTGRQADFSARVQISIDNDEINLEGSSVVEVHGIIREIIVKRSFDEINLRYLDLSPMLTLAEFEVSGSLRLSGPQLVVEALRLSDLSLEVVCGEVVEPGMFELPVRPRLPDGVTVVSFLPVVVSVRVVSDTPPDEEQEMDGQP